MSLVSLENVTNYGNLSTPDGQYKTTTEQNNYEIYEDVAGYFWKVISPIIFIVGITGNTAILIALKRMRFQRRPPLIFLFALAFFDMIVLCVGLSQYWVLYTFDYNLRLVGQAGCKLSLFIIYWSMQCCSWILVCVVFERFLKIKFPLKYMRLVTIPRCIRIIIIVIVLLALIDMHLFFTNGITNHDNETECTSLNAQYLQFDEYVFIWIDMVFISILPFILMITMNAFIIHALREYRRWRDGSVPNPMTADRMNRVDTELTTMLLFTSFYFLLTTAPISIYYAVDSYKKTRSDYDESAKEISRTVLYLFQFTNYAMNYIVYNLSNKRFGKKRNFR